MSPTNETVPILLSLLAFVVLCLICLNLLQFLLRRMAARALKRRVSEATEAAAFTNGNPSKESGSARVRTGAIAFLTTLGSRFFKGQGDKYSRTRGKLAKAGIRHASAPAVLWGTKILLAVLFVASFLVARLTPLKIFTLFNTIAVGMLVGAVGFYLPDIFLDMKRARRKDRIVKALPDALDLMVVCLEAGMGLDSGRAAGPVPAPARTHGQCPAGSLKGTIPYHGPRLMAEVKAMVARGRAKRKVPR